MKISEFDKGICLGVFLVMLGNTIAHLIEVPQGLIYNLDLCLTLGFASALVFYLITNEKTS